jgi:hypothetical protein
VNFSQQQVIAWLPSGHTICSTEIIRGKPKIVTFFQKTPLWPSLIQSRFLHHLFRQRFNAAVIGSAAAAENCQIKPTHAHASSSRAPKSRNRGLTVARCFAFANLALLRIIARRKLPSTIRQRGRVAESGLRHSTRNRAWGNPPWVRIPPLPPRRTTFSISSIFDASNRVRL